MEPTYLAAGIYWLGFVLMSVFTPVCGCGKVKLSVLLFSTHRKLQLLVYMLITDITIGVVYYLLSSNSRTHTFTAAMWTLYVGLDVARIYYHEKDKFKKASKALGRVFVTNTGRLAVAKE